MHAVRVCEGEAHAHLVVPRGIRQSAAEHLPSEERRADVAVHRRDEVHRDRPAHLRDLQPTALDDLRQSRDLVVRHLGERGVRIVVGERQDVRRNHGLVEPAQCGIGAPGAGDDRDHPAGEDPGDEPDRTPRSPPTPQVRAEANGDRAHSVIVPDRSRGRYRTTTVRVVGVARPPALAVSSGHTGGKEVLDALRRARPRPRRTLTTTTLYRCGPRGRSSVVRAGDS